MVFITVLAIVGTLTTFIASSVGDIPSDYALNDAEYLESVQADFIFFEIVEPEELAYTYKMTPAAFGGEWNISYHSMGLVPSVPECGCGRIENAEEIEGKLALIDRGECSFVSKVIRAQAAGAVGAIVTDRDRENDEFSISMVDDTTDRSVNIPAAFLLGKNGYIIKHTLRKLQLDEALVNLPVNITQLSLHKLKQPPWLVW
jgi:hypothetical protein